MLDVFCAGWEGKRPFSKRGSVPAAEDDLRPSILQPNTEGLTASKIIVLVLEQLAHRNIGACHRLLGNPPLRNYSQSIDSQLPTSWALGQSYLGVTLDRTLTYRHHLESLHKKLTSRVALFPRLAGSGWGVGATKVRTATLALVHSTVKYCTSA